MYTKQKSVPAALGHPGWWHRGRSKKLCNQHQAGLPHVGQPLQPNVRTWKDGAACAADLPRIASAVAVRTLLHDEVLFPLLPDQAHSEHNLRQSIVG